MMALQFWRFGFLFAVIQNQQCGNVLSGHGGISGSGNPKIKLILTKSYRNFQRDALTALAADSYNDCFWLYSQTQDGLCSAKVSKISTLENGLRCDEPTQ